MDLQDQQILTVFYSGYPAPEWAKLKDYVAARTPNIMKGVCAVQRDTRNSGNTEWCEQVSFLLPILLQEPDILKTRHAQFIVKMITNWGENTNWKYFCAENGIVSII